MRNLLKNTLLATAATTAMTSGTFAGGLADAIVEREPVIIPQVAEESSMNWLLPLAAIVVVGALVASRDGGSDNDPAPDPSPQPDVAFNPLDVK